MEKAEEILESRNPMFTAKNPCIEDPAAVRLSDAFLLAMSTRNWTEYTEKVERYHIGYFLKWADKRGLKYWGDLRYEHVLQYKKSLIKRGLAYDTVRLYLRPIRQTSFWMSSNWPKQYIHFCEHVRLSQNEFRTAEYSEEEGNPYLSVNQILDFLDWLSRDPYRDRLTLGVSLQGLVGLQMQEVVRLEWSKVDLEEGTIIIDGTVKNRYRIRKIPVPRVVHHLLRRARGEGTDAGRCIPEIELFTSYSKAVRFAMDDWNPSLQVKSKDLRNTLQTTAIDGGWYGYYVQRYVGHSPKTVGERHYHADQGKRMIPMYREHVVDHVNQMVQKWRAPLDSVICPGPRLAVVDKVRLVP